MITKSDKWLFQLFSASYKDIKSCIFKVTIKEKGQKKIFYVGDQLKFPLY